MYICEQIQQYNTVGDQCKKIIIWICKFRYEKCTNVIILLGIVENEIVMIAKVQKCNNSDPKSAECNKF
jgi:hypothetical protein